MTRTGTETADQDQSILQIYPSLYGHYLLVTIHSATAVVAHFDRALHYIYIVGGSTVQRFNILQLATVGS